MFQNITMDVTEDEIKRVNNKRDIGKIIKRAINGQSVILYICALMLSCVDGIGLNYSVFAMAIFAAKKIYFILNIYLTKRK